MKGWEGPLNLKENLQEVDVQKKSNALQKGKGVCVCVQQTACLGPTKFRHEILTPRAIVPGGMATGR